MRYVDRQTSQQWQERLCIKFNEINRIKEEMYQRQSQELSTFNKGRDMSIKREVECHLQRDTSRNKENRSFGSIVNNDYQNNVGS